MGKHVYIRVDGNEIIATGHVMRCMTIAETLRRQNMEVTFVTADHAMERVIKQRDFEIDVLGTQWNELDSEMECLMKYIQLNEVEVLLMDSYYVTKEYLQKLSQCTKIIYIDDLLSFPYDVYSVINYSVFMEQTKYNELYFGKKTPELLIGGSYIPLREEFTQSDYKVNEQVKRVLITTGGTDSMNVSGCLLEALLENRDSCQLEYHIIVGRFNRNREKLLHYQEMYSNIVLHENVTEMSRWMKYCDIAISASGSTLYELCACGIPSICIEIADNQRGAEKWQERDCMQYAGNACDDLELCIWSCVQGVLLYKSDYELRCRRSMNMHGLVDGKGTLRIAEYINGLLSTQ